MIPEAFVHWLLGGYPEYIVCCGGEYAEIRVFINELLKMIQTSKKLTFSENLLKTDPPGPEFYGDEDSGNEN